tara:strand:+ start:7898 stop:8344 length:447 start_codon:yes stop_codon:yes gene_type:complete
MHRQLVVPTYMVNGGLDYKFQSEPREVPGLASFVDKLTESDYQQSIRDINAALKKSRAGILSISCLVSGPLIFPLVPYTILTYRNKRKRKTQLLRAIENFNDMHPTLFMRLRRNPNSVLVIEDASNNFSKRLETLNAKAKVEDFFLNV